jgi:citrate lyase gamma subunit
MALPILETATYELTLPSSDVQVKYRPFLVKEEKVLLIAMESEDGVQITRALKEIVRTCTFNSIEVESLPTFDLEYIFLNVRAKSVGEVTKLKLLCPDDKETYANVELDLSKVEVQVDDKHSNEISISDKIKMIMKYPTIDTFDPSIDASKLKTNQLFDIIANTVYEIYDGETVHKASDYSKEEMNKFIESLTSDHFGKIQQFFNTMPRLQHEIEIENPKTKVKSKVMLSGLQSFFVSPSHMTT